MNELNDIHYTNDDPIADVRYTNDDIPINERYNVDESRTYSEFGTSARVTEEEAKASVRLTNDYNIAKIAATFAVVSLVAMSVVLDESPFGAVFDPVMDIFTEGFGNGGDEGGYMGNCEMTLTVTDTEVRYIISFDTEPGDSVRLHIDSTASNLTRRSVDVTASDSEVINTRSGSETGLVSGTTYRIYVTVGDKTVATQTKTMLDSYDARPSVVLDPEFTACYCLEDGTFHLKVKRIYDGDGFGQYHVNITYQDGTVAGKDFSGNVTDLQKIDVDTSKAGETVTLEISCIGSGSSTPITIYTEYNVHI